MANHLFSLSILRGLLVAEVESMARIIELEGKKYVLCDRREGSELHLEWEVRGYKKEARLNVVGINMPISEVGKKYHILLEEVKGKGK